MNVRKLKKDQWNKTTAQKLVIYTQRKNSGMDGKWSMDDLIENNKQQRYEYQLLFNTILSVLHLFISEATQVISYSFIKAAVKNMHISKLEDFFKKTEEWSVPLWNKKIAVRLKLNYFI